MEARFTTLGKIVSDMVLSCLVAIVIGTIILAIGIGIGANTMRKQALERGYAQYRTDTGEWVWKCDLEKAE